MAMHIRSVSLEFPHKVCFRDFETDLEPGSRVAIIGRNGAGKSTLLKMIAQQLGDQAAYVPQIIEDWPHLSGGERFNKKLSEAIGCHADYLLLDEPTNHLDRRNRTNLMRMLNQFRGTLIVVTHDIELLRNCIDIIWHIDQGRVHEFRGNYDDYMQLALQTKQNLENQKLSIKNSKKKLREKIQKNLERAAKSKARGKQKVASGSLSKMAGDLRGMRAEKARGKTMQALDEAEQNLSSQLQNLFIPKVIVPKFNLTGREGKSFVNIVKGAIGYAPDRPILRDINISTGESFAISGSNGSGKSTLAKAIFGDKTIYRQGEWLVPKHIRYIDQYYTLLDRDLTVFETIQQAVPTWSANEIRRFLNDFLFQKNEEIETPVRHLSGGELARLSMAKIAAAPPVLMILDEITNNIDLETRNHLISVLQSYDSQLIAISHDRDFLEAIGVTKIFDIADFQ